MDTSKYVKGLAGQLYDTSPRVCISAAAEEIIPMGVPLMRGTNLEKQVKKFNGGISTEMVGVAGRSVLQVNGDYSPTQPQAYYSIGDMVTVVQKGKVWIPLTGSQTITVGDRAYIDTLFDKITNVFTDSITSIPIGTFLTGGVAATYDPITFVLELDIGFSEEIPSELAKEADNKDSNNNLNTKKEKNK